MDVPYPNTAHTFKYGTVTFTFGTVLGVMISHIVTSTQCKGIDPAVFLDDHDTMATWKLQYEDLPTYNIPGNEAIRLLTPDDLAPLPPVTYLI